MANWKKLDNQFFGLIDNLSEEEWITWNKHQKENSKKRRTKMENKNTIKYIKGNLLDELNNYDIIIHGCNCFCVMGAGIAKQISNKYPEVLLIDKQTIKGDINKLGNYSEYKAGKFSIINGYSQYSYGLYEPNSDKSKTERIRLNAIEKLFINLKKDFGNKNLKFLFPLIGSGLAGGDSFIINNTINKIMKNEDLTCIIWDKDVENVKKFNL
jgi:O-acetyl-ADP-ribose deacetylase (regulator of RNase III)